MPFRSLPLVFGALRGCVLPLLGVALLAAEQTACSPEVPAGRFACALGDLTGCPDGWTCECRGAQCQPRCYAEVGRSCGNGVLDPGERCDGSDLPPSFSCPNGLGYCNSDCTLACTDCGNGAVERAPGDAREECDDGNRSPGDGCSPTCIRERRDCGNGVVDTTELCDDGNLLSHDGCSSQCQIELPVSVLDPAPHASVSPRTSPATAYDAARGRVVLYGGQLQTDDGVQTLGDTWEWDGDAWYQVSTSGPRLLPGGVPSMTYHPLRQRVILVAEGVWEWDGKRWSRLPSAHSAPSPRAGWIVYDAGRAKLLLREATTRLMWEWNEPTAIWQRLPADAGVDPPAGAMVYDPSVGQVILIADGVWRWNNRWTKAISKPIDAGANQLVYEPRRRQLIAAKDGASWSWDSTTGTALRLPDLPLRAPHYAEEVRNAALLHHTALDRTVMVGGLRAQGSTFSLVAGQWSRDPIPTYELIGGPYLKLFDERRGAHVALGIGAEARNWRASGARWTALATTPIRPPASGLRAVYDNRRDRAVVFAAPPAAPAPQLWIWSGEAWQVLSAPLPCPPPTTEPCPEMLVSFMMESELLYDQAKDELLLIGSEQRTLRWVGGQFRPLTTSPSLLQGTSTTYDRVRAQVIRFGERRDPQLPPQAHVAELQTTPTATWRLTPSSGPPSFALAELWFDADRQRVLHRDALGGIWEWEGMLWREVTTGPALAARPFAAALAREDNAPPVRYQSEFSREESCRFGFDADGDGAIGCGDPDCWRLCTPLCSPGQPCFAGAPRCGDGACNPFLETPRLCPSDCGFPVATCGDFLCNAADAGSCHGDCR